MPSLSELVARAREAKPRTLDRRLLFDQDASAQIAQVEAELAAVLADTDKRLGEGGGAAALQQRLDELRAASAGTLVTFRLTEIPGDQWADITTTCPPRPDSQQDAQLGYNLTAAAKKALPIMTQYLDGDELVDVPEDAWDVIWGLNDWDLLEDGVLNLQWLGPIQRAEAAAKKSLAASEPTPDSPPDSGSPSSGSTGGSPGSASVFTTTATGGSTSPTSRRKPNSTRTSARS